MHFGGKLSGFAIVRAILISSLHSRKATDRSFSRKASPREIRHLDAA
jgi:hypothetical protein